MLIYRLVLTLAWPLLAAALIWRVLRGRERWRDLRERLGFVGTPDAPLLWVHGASNGEMASARAVITALVDAHPDHAFLITTNSITGRQMVADWALPRSTARLASIDTWWARPRAVAHVTLESEIWPNRIKHCPTVVLGARLSERTARTWHRLPGLARSVFPHIALVMPQDAGSAQRYAQLGTPKDRITAPVQLKSGYTPPDRAVPSDIAAALPHAQTWLAASTHPGDEEVVLDAHQKVLTQDPQARLILAPRHPKRADEIAALIAQCGLTAHRRSTGPVPPQATILLADTMGEMDLWYRSAFATFIGGTLSDRGGHTPYEPASLNSAIIHGPDTANFAEAFAALTPKGAIQISNAETLAQAIIHLKSEENHDAMTHSARETLGNSLEIDPIVRQLSLALNL